LNKEPKKRTPEDLESLMKMVEEIKFFNEFKKSHGDKESQKLLRRCYHE
jgi:hypothetical protein